MTVLDLIHSSLRLIGQLGPGRKASTSETTDALLILNSMLETWSTQRLAIYTTTRNAYTWAASLSSQTIGPGGDIDAPRPVATTEIGFIESDLEWLVDLIDASRWAKVSNKSATGLPDRIYLDRGFPLETLWPWPIPENEISLVIYAWEEIAEFVQLTQVLHFPKGYADAIRYNLAIHLGEEWGRPVNSRVEKMAATKLGYIKRLNMPSLELGVDEALLGNVGRGAIQYGR